MFGIDDALIWGPMLGAVAGGLMSKKNPMQGALLGAGVGLGGAGLLGAAPAAAGAAELSAGTMLNGVPLAGGMSVPAGSVMAGGMPLAGGMSIAPGAAVTSSLPAASGGGLLASAKPYMEAASAANSVNKMFQSEPEKPIQASPIVQNMPNNTLGQIVGGMEQGKQNQLALDQQKRQARRQMIRGMA